MMCRNKKEKNDAELMQEECLICKAPLEYLKEDMEMECEICHKKERSKTRCVNGHYVCSECHMQGIDSLIGICMEETSKNPALILNRMMALPFCHMHGPEHHVMVGMALLTAYKNAGGDLNLKKALAEMNSRGKTVPGGACGFWGACGAGISAGMFLSIVTGSTPLGEDNFGLSHKMTARALEAIGEVGGPRCCKRDAYLSILQAVDFVRENLGIHMERPKIRCSYSGRNNQCIGKRCPFCGAKKKIAFICVHNSCRSQIAEALGKKYLSDFCDCYSAGTEVRPQINQDAVRLMKREYGIDMERDQYSKLLGEIPEADLYVSMGCNVACPRIPGKQMVNWGLEDPTEKDDAAFLEVIRQIEEKVRELRELNWDVADAELCRRVGKMRDLHEELLAVEEERKRGIKGHSIEEVEAMMDSVIKEATE